MWKMRLLRKEIDYLILILLFSSLLLVIFTFPEINKYSFEEYLIGVGIIFLISLILLKKYKFQKWAIIFIIFLIFTLVRNELSLLAPSFIFIVFPFYWAKHNGKKYSTVIQEYGLRVKNKFSIIMCGVIGLFLIILLVGLIGLFFYLIDMNDQANVKDVVRSLPWISIPFAIILAPLAEEIFFRGFLLKKLGLWASAIIFAVLHFAYGSIVEIAAAFAIALLLSYLFVKTKSLWPSIIAHSLFNLLALTVMWL